MAEWQKKKEFGCFFFSKKTGQMNSVVIEFCWQGDDKQNVSFCTDLSIFNEWMAVRNNCIWTRLFLPQKFYLLYYRLWWFFIPSLYWFLLVTRFHLSKNPVLCWSIDNAVALIIKRIIVKHNAKGFFIIIFSAYSFSSPVKHFLFSLYNLSRMLVIRNNCTSAFN